CDQSKPDIDQQADDFGCQPVGGERVLLDADGQVSSATQQDRVIYMRQDLHQLVFHPAGIIHHADAANNETHDRDDGGQHVQVFDGDIHGSVLVGGNLVDGTVQGVFGESCRDMIAGR